MPRTTKTIKTMIPCSKEKTERDKDCAILAEWMKRGDHDWREGAETGKRFSGPGERRRKKRHEGYDKGERLKMQQEGI